MLAAACGLTVANLYYAQPLLDLIADDFGVSRGRAALVVTMTQVGYVLGLLFVLALGDLLETGCWWSAPWSAPPRRWC